MYDEYDLYTGKRYILRVHKGLFKKCYVDHIDIDEEMIYYTQDPYEAGVFYPYERAVDVARILEEQQQGVTKVDIIDKA